MSFAPPYVWVFRWILLRVTYWKHQRCTEQLL